MQRCFHVWTSVKVKGLKKVTCTIVPCCYYDVWKLTIFLLFLYNRKFFIDASSVDDAETNFGIDQYSDVTMVAKPVVYMTVQEIIDTHQVCHLSPYLSKFIGTCSFKVNVIFPLPSRELIFNLED